MGMSSLHTHWILDMFEVLHKFHIKTFFVGQYVILEHIYSIVIISNRLQSSRFFESTITPVWRRHLVEIWTQSMKNSLGHYFENQVEGI